MKTFGEVGENRLKVLLIEDDPDDALMFRHALPDAFRLLIAENGEEGLKQIKEHRPQICFLDLKLPGKSGEDICKEVRLDEIKEISEIPIVMISGKTTEADQIVGRVIGANAYLAKPCRPESILEQIERLIGAPFSPAKSNCVLIIDDDPDDALLCQTLLHKDRTQSYRILTAESMRQGISMIEEHKPDAVICDLELPDSSAHDTCQTLKAVGRTVPCIILTGHEDELLAEEAIRSGVQDYVLKERLDPKTLSRSLRYSIERFALTRQVARLSTTDELTGLLNRRGFLAMAERQLELQRRSNRLVQLLFIDMDKLKMVNDAYGHETGDKAICRIADVLKHTIRKADLVGRIGGDEFVLMAWNEKPDDETRPIAIRIQQALRKFNRTGLLPFELSVSIGSVVERSSQIESIEQLISAADQKMYSAKKNQGPIIRQPFHSDPRQSTPSRPCR